MALSYAAEIESFYKHSGLGLCVLDREMRYVRINQRLAEMNGASAADHMGKTVREVVPGIYIASLPIFRKVLGTGQPVLGVPLSGETRAQPGVTRHWVEHWLPICSPNGQTLGVNVIVEEVTAHKLTADALRQSEADLAEAQRVAKIGNWTFDLATSKLRWSRELYRIFGVKERKDGIPLRSFFACVDTRDRPFVMQAIKEAVTTGKPVDLEYRIATPDGTLKTIRTTGYARRNKDGMIVGLFGTSEDITLRKCVEQALQQSEQRYRSLLNFAVDGILIGTQNGIVTDANECACGLFGLPREEIVGRHITELPFSKESLANNPFRFDLVHAGETTVRDREVLRQDGTRVVVEIHAKMMADGTLQAILHDITDRKRVEAALERAHAELECRVEERTAKLRQRSLQLAKLATELTLVEHRERRHIADYLHDNLQQLLVACRMQAGALASRKPQTHRASLETLNDTLAEAIQAARAVTRQIAPPVPVYGNLPEAFQWLVHEVGRLHNLAVAIDSPSDLPAVPEAESLLLFTAARELLLNVVKHAGVPEARLRVACTPAAITLTVGDSGCGTVRSDTAFANQHGFGLFSIRERAESLGGSLTVDSKPGHGTRVTITLPLAAAPTACRQPGNPGKGEQAVAQAPEQKGHAVSGRRRVLFVDDHQIVRESLVNLLKMETDIHVVGQCDNGSAAVESAGQLQPDVVIMDVNMPVMDGIEATRRIKELWPGIKVIGLSTFDDADGGGKMRAAGADGYVSKSAPPQELIETIRQCCRAG